MPARVRSTAARTCGRYPAPSNTAKPSTNPNIAPSNRSRIPNFLANFQIRTGCLPPPKTRIEFPFRTGKLIVLADHSLFSFFVGPKTMNTCHCCAGTGLRTGQLTIDCAACEGTGQILGAPCYVCGGDRVQTTTTDVPCPECDGSGRLSSLTPKRVAVLRSTHTQLMCVAPAAQG